MRSKFELGVTTTIKEKEKIALNMLLVHLLISWAEEQKYKFEFSVDQNFANNEPYTSSVVLYVFYFLPWLSYFSLSLVPHRRNKSETYLNNRLS